MDNFKKPSQQPRRPMIARRGTHGMPASRPSVVKVPPQEQQLTDVPASSPHMSESQETTVPSEALKQLNLEVKEARYPRRHYWVKRGVRVLIVALVTLVIGALIWYGVQLTPPDSSNEDLVAVQVKPGSSPDEIASQLKHSNVIRSELAFLLTARLQGVQGELQAGAYRLSPSESLFAIIDHMVKGMTDTFEITFFPGETLADHRDAMLKAGYSRQEVDEAFEANYDSPLFEGKPDTADLEGYIYADTYKFNMGVSAKKVLEQVFAEFYRVLSERRLDRGYEKRGLTLFEGITLASIIQREAVGGDERQISQVFHKRLSMDMPLGSDPTYQYIADKTGVERDINLDSPYNTRRYGGLPPGPIASPGIEALRAVSLPADGDYLYFLSGDDDVTYYSKTLEEHEGKIKKHCQKKCQII